RLERLDLIECLAEQLRIPNESTVSQTRQCFCRLNEVWRGLTESKRSLKRWAVFIQQVIEQRLVREEVWIKQPQERKQVGARVVHRRRRYKQERVRRVGDGRAESEGGRRRIAHVMGLV